MAQLFGKWTIKSHLEVLPWFDESKIEIIKELHKDWKNGLLTDEVKYKEKFNQIFFWDLLGYENRTHRIPEWTIPWAGSADITLWNFTDGKYELENIQVVCELKWAKTNLTKKQFWHGWLSPVGQGFAYKTWLKNCKRLIVSNFYEIMLYRDNTTDFEVWNLDELLDPKDQYFNLRKLYLLLHKDNLLSFTSISKTEKLLSHFREEQKEITTKFYKEYKELRIELINDMKLHNPWTSIEVIIEKAQKIIDRLIFIFFCEDKGLLPDKRLKESILKAWEFNFTPWEITKKFFSSVDKWSEQLGIPHGYNGWLFKEDEIVNGLNIWDGICRKFVNLTNYNFDDQLSVNVLWHIFEQSISDLENLKIDLLGTETPTDQLVEISKWRRKKDGIFYTPEYIVDYIVQNSVMKYLNEKEDECLWEVSTLDEKTWDRRRKKNIENPEQKAYLKYQQILQNIKVLDPACGSGAFLVRVFDVLFGENKRVGSILNSLFDESETYKNILTNNIYGVDLNEESVEITKLSLWLKSAQKGKKLNNLDNNIKCGNSLIDDPAVAGDKAFDWKKEFPWILWYWMKLPMKLWQKKEVGFDIIVWNPPYVFARENFNEKEKNFYIEKYVSAQYQINTYFLFIELCVRLSKNKGYFWLIVPNSWLMISSWNWLRTYLLENTTFLEVINLLGNTFEDANVETIIMINQKGYQPKNIINISDNKLWYISFIHGKQQDQYFDKKNNGLYLFSDDKKWWLIDKIKKWSRNLDDIVLIKAWLKAYESWKWIPKQTTEDVKNRPFDYNYKYDDNTYMYLEWKDVQRYNINWSWLYLKYWTHLAAPRTFDLFDSEKIIIREITGQYPKSLIWTYTNQTYLFNMSNICIKQNNKDINLKYILTLLSSSLLSYYFVCNTAKSERKLFPKIILEDLRRFPIKEISLKDQQPFIERADKMLSLNKELHELTDKFLHRIQDNLKIQKLTRKLESFYDWDFKDFLDELKKQKILLPLFQQDEREPYFKESKEKILALKGEIERTDGEINEMIFDLYELSEEERSVVLGG